MAEPTVAWVGGIYFRDDFARQGFNVIPVTFSTPRALTWDALCEECGLEPDIVVYNDRSLPPPLVGVESFPCLTVFYCIDSHIHEWYPAYAQGFDLCAVSLRDHLPRFRLRLAEDRVFWLPPYPIRDEHPPVEPVKREWDLLFAGNVDPETTPRRHAFLKELKEHFPGLVVRQGVFSELFPKARIVLNIAERGDLNFRVFEALATRSCLLTPKLGHGQDELFEDGRHLFTYPSDDAQAVALLARQLLEDPERCEAAREAGYLRINDGNRREHRAALLAERIRRLDRHAVVADRIARADEIKARHTRLIYLHWANAEKATPLGHVYLAAAKK